MNRNVIIFLGAVSLCCSPDVLAQSGMSACQEQAIPDIGNAFVRTERRNFWNSGRNAAGVRQDTVSVSCAWAGGKYVSGGFRDCSDAASSWSAGAKAATIMHLKTLSLTGAFSFVNFSGSGMCGSMSSRPGYYPVDVLEFTPGKKTLQTYGFEGGISVDLGRSWRLGGKIDFTGANYTKRKDLRHTDYLLYLTVSPSVMHYGDGWAVGLSAVFNKNSETIDAEELGISSSTYYAFLDKGLMYGAYESWEGSGVHLSESGIDGFPVRELVYGGAAQFQRRGFYAELEYLYGTGRAGEKQTVWFLFTGHTVSLKAGYSFGTESRRNYLRLSADWKSQSNHETVLNKVTEGGVTTTEVYGSNLVFGRRMLSVRPEYGLDAESVRLIAGLGIVSLDRQASPLYPYIFTEHDVMMSAYLSGEVPAGNFDILAGLRFSTGSRVADSRTDEADVDAESEPYRLEDWYNMQNEYMLASRLGVKLGARYRFADGLYAEAAAQYFRGFNLRYLAGPDRWTVALAVGYVF